MVELAEVDEDDKIAKQPIPAAPLVLLNAIVPLGQETQADEPGNEYVLAEQEIQESSFVLRLGKYMPEMQGTQ